MAQDDLKKYIQESLAAGRTIDDVRQDLIKAGWQEADVRKVFEELGIIKQSHNYLSFFGIFSLIMLSLGTIELILKAKYFLFGKYIQYFDIKLLISPPNIFQPFSNFMTMVWVTMIL